MKKKIFIDAEVLVSKHFSGIGHYVLNLAMAIDHQISFNQNVSVYFLVYYKDAAKLERFGFKNIKIKRTCLPLRITNALKRFNIQPPLDLFFGYGTYVFPNYTSWPLLLSKNISMIYDLSYEKYPEFAEINNQKFLSKQVKKTAKWADKVVTISKNSLKEISNYYNIPKDKICILYPLIDESIYYKRPKIEIDLVKKKYDLPDNYILSIGNLEPRKNLQNLLYAYEQLPKNIVSKYSLLIVGSSGWNSEGIKNQIKSLVEARYKIIRPKKYITDSDLPAVYSGSTLFVFPSIYEGFGIPPVEALACGCNVLAADNSSLPEAVGSSAIFVNALSVESIKNGIIRGIENSNLNKSSAIKQAGKFCSKKFRDEVNLIFFK